MQQPPGPRSMFSNLQAIRAIAHLCAGKTYKSACAIEGVPYTTLNAWVTAFTHITNKTPYGFYSAAAPHEDGAVITSAYAATPLGLLTIYDELMAEGKRLGIDFENRTIVTATPIT